MFLMKWHFLNEKINKNDLTRKKQTDPVKTPFSHSPSNSEMHKRESDLVLDAAAMPPPSTENGDLLPLASSKRQPLPR